MQWSGVELSSTVVIQWGHTTVTWSLGCVYTLRGIDDNLLLTKDMLYASESIPASSAAPCIVIGAAVAVKHHVEDQPALPIFVRSILLRTTSLVPKEEVERREAAVAL